MANRITVKDTQFNVGDTVKIHYNLADTNEKTKLQVFEGIVLDVNGKGDNRMFTVRKITKSNIGVERIFPAISPFIEKVDIAKKTTSRKAKVNYVRTRSKREIKDKLYR
ncbi:hypothetical protein A2957_03120 [Candidatus Roizmanbacteria bacterium RIFCSPLOWO2_01_FULL_38_11]|uniref:50S ribosomal protein L19 n=1 Tax=Candidatus Roizmanbacteria bacterium RIFCSPLOWO2_01_FULL_38_11 TaxID=1802060 RepID=A0A1F7IK73_9BACT|nr:MAG: hypothetical protein A2957_03120 [Candidatus Roizmanbacteria bacterium RIFCSPLOWO2_01_FULL_38_11]